MTHNTKSRKIGSHAPAVRAVVVVLGLIASGWGVWTVGRMGTSRLLSEYGVLQNSPDAINVAALLTPNDPEARYARAVMLAGNNDARESLAEYERAVSLRPSDYVLWQELGRARDGAGDLQGALDALSKAVSLAPYYAQPRWQMGNVLLRSNRREEAFDELRRAARSNPKFFAALSDLAWGAYGGDAVAVEAAVQPQSYSERMTLARYFAKRGMTAQALDLYRAAGSSAGASVNIAEEDRQALLKELLDTGKYRDAYQVWAAAGSKTNGEDGAINNESFEESVLIGDTGFGWRFARASQAVAVSVDLSRPFDRARSLRIDLSGDSVVSQAIVSQIILVNPGARYKLSFAARTEEITTGGLPYFAVGNVKDGGRTLLGRSKDLPQGTSDWREYEVEFQSPADAEAVMVFLRRQDCNATPCPAFGRVWLDKFTIEKM